MEYERFIKLVQERGGIEQFGVAERAASAVLEVLGEHLTEEQANSIAEQLPTHIRDAILQKNTAGSFGLQEFIRRVAEREEVTVREAEPHVLTVLAVLPDVISFEKARDAVKQLPEEISALLQTEHKAAVSG